MTVGILLTQFLLRCIALAITMHEYGTMDADQSLSRDGTMPDKDTAMQSVNRQVSVMAKSTLAYKKEQNFKTRLSARMRWRQVQKIQQQQQQQQQKMFAASHNQMWDDGSSEEMVVDCNNERRSEGRLSLVEGSPVVQRRFRRRGAIQLVKFDESQLWHTYANSKRKNDAGSVGGHDWNDERRSEGRPDPVEGSPVVLRQFRRRGAMGCIQLIKFNESQLWHKYAVSKRKNDNDNVGGLKWMNSCVEKKKKEDAVVTVTCQLLSSIDLGQQNETFCLR
mmetsp:Transcript_16969/g.28815  ORF Transcript_16969/g.28815 Transcript_16969/m.28815 type:complete len:278 (-) Transcript_16969:106-939(-)